MPDDALASALVGFKKGSYRMLYVTCGPIELGNHLSSYQSYAELGAATLSRIGMPADILQAIPGPRAVKDRTYTSAIALRDWQRANGITPTRYLVISLGPHARRTRLLFEMAMGERTEVGITAVREHDYDEDHWRRSSVGVRTVTGEAIAYT
jgi:hypothetical protein